MDELKYFAGYFHQDYDLVSGTPDDVIAHFKRDETGAEVNLVIDDIETLMASQMTDAEIYDLWVMKWYGGYDPSFYGTPYRDWFAHVLELLRSPTGR